MSKNTWKCSCGTENSGNFCSVCGKAKGAGSANANGEETYTEQYLKLQIKQQELLNAQEEKRMAMEAEKNRKKREYETQLKEYNEKVRQVSPNLLKNWAGSWIVLVLSICATVAAACSLGSFFTNLISLKSGILSFIVAAVKLLLGCIVCAGFWQSYVMGRKKDSTINSRSVKMLSGVSKFYQVIAYILCILIIVLFIIVFAGIKSCANEVTSEAEQMGMDLSEYNNSLTGVLIGIMIALIAVYGVIIFFFSSVNKFSKAVIGAFDTKVIQETSTIVLAVLFFIIGGFIFIGAISTVAANSLLNQFLSDLGAVGDYMSSAGLFSKIDIADMFSQFANAGMFIFGGILALKFSGLSEEAFRQKQAIKKPEMER